MDTTLIVIDSDAELARALKLIDELMPSNNPADAARLAAQARLIADYEQSEVPAAAVAHRRRHPLPDGPAWPFARRHGADSRQ